MYSNNDYRYYLEHRLAESDDYLAHYGVKGMKWRKHKAGLQTELSNIKTDLRNRGYGDKDHTYVDPVNGKIKPRKTRRAGESRDEGMLGGKDYIRGDYKVKRRTTNSKLFKGLKKLSGNKDTSKAERRQAQDIKRKKVDSAMYKVKKQNEKAFGRTSLENGTVGGATVDAVRTSKRNHNATKKAKRKAASRTIY